MKLLTGKSKDIIIKELYAGFLTYNIIRGYRVKAAKDARISPLNLSFTQCYRRIQNTVISLLYAHSLNHIIKEVRKLFIIMARCKLPVRPRFLVEPRAVRRLPVVYPNLKGARESARQLLLEQRKEEIKS